MVVSMSMNTSFENTPETYMAKVISFEQFVDRDIIVLLDANLKPILSTSPIGIIRSATEEDRRQAAKLRHPASTKRHPDLVLQ